MSEELFMIWSHKREAWWKQNLHGYASDMSEAGHFTFHQAVEIVRGANICLPIKKNSRPEDSMVPVPNRPTPSKTEEVEKAGREGIDSAVQKFLREELGTQLGTQR